MHPATTQEVPTRMVNVRYLLDLFANEARRTVLLPGWRRRPGYLELVEPKDRYSADPVHLAGKGMEIPADATAEDGTVFVLCDGIDSPVPDGASAIYLDAPLASVNNAILASIARAAEWSRLFYGLKDGSDFQAIVEKTADAAEAFTLLVGKSGTVLANSRTKHASCVSDGRSVDSVAQAVLRGAAGEDPFWSLQIEEGITLWCERIVHPDGASSVLAIEDVDGAVDRETICCLAAKTLGKILLAQSVEALNEEMQLFCKCWQGIMDRTYATNDEVRDALSRLPYQVHDFASIAVLTFPRHRGTVDFRDIFIQLRRLFPRENITLYEHDVVILLSQGERSFRPNFTSVDTNHLTKILKDNDGMMAISSKTRRVDDLPSLYYLAKRTALLAMALGYKDAEESRIVYYEDYSIYCIIDLAVKQYLKNPVNDDVVYLVHSAVIQLTRYDAEHHTNLRDVLYHYLMCDRNLVKTASATYMHRNTVLNKINKITSMLDLDLEDPNLRQKLILSCQVILYIERAMNRSLNL